MAADRFVAVLVVLAGAGLEVAAGFEAATEAFFAPPAAGCVPAALLVTSLRATLCCVG